MRFAAEYQQRCRDWSDIVDHLPRLYTEAVTRPECRVIELGVRNGNSTAAFLAAADRADGHVWSVDLEEPRVPAWWRESERWTPIVGDDLAVADQLPGRVDVLFVDSSHAYRHTLAELETYVPKVAPGGVVMLHDTEVDYPENLPHEEAWPVRRAVEEFFAGRDIEWVTGCYGLAVIRI